jgi:uncharacterized protein
MRRLFALLSLFLLALAAPALAAPDFPERGTAPVVDAANVIDDAAEAQLSQKLDDFEMRTGRQFVVATVPDLQGYDIADYGYQLGRYWHLGSKEENNGIILLVAPNEHKVRIEVGYGLESIIPDGLAYDIINQDMTPRFKAGDMTGGIVAGADRILQQLELPPDQQKKVAAAAGKQRASGDGGFPIGAIVWMGFILFFVILPMIRRRRGRYYSGSGAGSGIGNVLMWTALNAAMNSGRHGGSDWGGGGGGGWGGGGFTGGGGGSFGGGGASGGW